MRKPVVVVAAGALSAVAAVAFFTRAPLQAQSSTGGAGGTPPQVQYSCQVPYDVTFTDPGSPQQRDFDVYSWNIFLALNWPAATATSGAAPCNEQNGVALNCGQPLPSGDYGPTVWETYKPEWAIFQGSAAGATPPAGWNCPLPPLPGCDTLGMRDALDANLPVARMIIKDGNTANEFKQAGTFAPLIDQNGSFVRYEMRVNRDEFDFINNNKLWDSNNITADVNFQPVGDNDKRTIGPIEVKAAWKVLTQGDNAERFHRRSVVVAWPNKNKSGTYQCKTFQMGLVGLHIAHKTQNAPQWIWSTFEQVDNYKGSHPSFHDPDCTNCPPNKLPTAPAAGWSGDPTIKQSPPTQVVVDDNSAARVGPSAAQLNSEVQSRLAAMGSVWQYYELVSTQWPSIPYTNGKPSEVNKKNTLPNQGAGQIPMLLANTTMETYLMGPSDASNTSSCMQCHSMAMDPSFAYRADFSYLLQDAYPGAASNNVAATRRLNLARTFHQNTARAVSKTKKQ